MGCCQSSDIDISLSNLPLAHASNKNLETMRQQLENKQIDIEGTNYDAFKLVMSIYALTEQYQYNGSQNKDKQFFRNTYNSGMSLLGIFINLKETNIYIGDSIATQRFYFRPETFEVKTTFDFENYVRVLTREEIVHSYNEDLEKNIETFKKFHEMNRLVFVEEMNQPVPEDNEPDEEDEEDGEDGEKKKEEQGKLPETTDKKATADKKETPEKKETTEVPMNEMKKENANNNEEIEEEAPVHEETTAEKPKKKNKKKKPKIEDDVSSHSSEGEEKVEKKKKKKKKEVAQPEEAADEGSGDI